MIISDFPILTVLSILLIVSGTLIGITNTFATIPGILIPIFVGEITHANVCTQNKLEYYVRALKYSNVW